AHRRLGAAAGVRDLPPAARRGGPAPGAAQAEHGHDARVRLSGLELRDDPVALGTLTMRAWVTHGAGLEHLRLESRDTPRPAARSATAASPSSCWPTRPRSSSRRPS